jgi:hypothetical protein
MHTALPAKPAATADPLEVFIAGVKARAYLVHEGELDLHEAVDVLQDFAEQAGLVNALGQDAVQAIMAKGSAAVPANIDADVVTQPVLSRAPEIRAAASTVEALMFSLCQRGAAVLSETATQSRLAALSTAQVYSVIERLLAARPRFPAIDDELLFLLGEQLA